MTIARVGTQAGGATVDASATAARAFPGNVAVGSLVVIAASKFDSSAHVAFTAGNCTKSAGTATLGPITLDETLAGTDIRSGVWSALVTGAGSLTLQIAGGSANSFWSLGSAEYSGSFDASRVEDHKTGSGTGTTQATASMTSAGAALFYGVVSYDIGTNDTGISEGSGYNRVYRETDGTAHQPGLISDQIVTVGTSKTYNTVSTGSNIYDIVGVVYKEVATGSAASSDGTGDAQAVGASIASAAMSSDGVGDAQAVSDVTTAEVLPELVMQPMRR